MSEITDHTMTPSGPDMIQALFVYRKGKRVKFLSLNEAILQKGKLKGWKHTATLEPIAFLKALLEGDMDTRTQLLNEVGVDQSSR
jgi:hypothetical protein